MFSSPWRNWPRRSPHSIQGRGRQRPSRPPALRPQLERLEDRTVPTVAITNYNGLNFGQTAAIQAFTVGGAAIPPDPQGAVGPYSYVEAVNLSVAIFDPRTNGINPTTDALDDFFGLQGNLPDPNPDIFADNFFTDPQVTFDDQTQRFIVGAMEVSPGPQFGPDFNGDNSSVFDVAVSKSANPTTLTTADWNFYQVRTTEANEFSDFPGNLGYNGAALVVTLNEINLNTQNTDHVLVTAINMSDLTNGVPQAGLHFYQSDYQGVSLRPTTMHDSTSASGPMWLVQEHPGAGGLGDGQHIDVVKMTNVLSTSPTFATTTLAVSPYTDVSLVPPRQPDGSVVTPDLDSRILKAAEQNNLLVATHSVSVSPTEDDARWYVIDVSGGTPTLKDQGDVSAGNHTYLTYPGIDINPAGDVGMSYMQSGTDTPTDFLSMYVTARTAADPPGTMEAPVLAQAGQQLYEDFGPSQGSDQRAGDLSGINVDAHGNFWAVNEFADNEPLPTPDAPSADWGTHITSFTLAPLAELSVTASGPGTVTPGATASYTITLTNNGPDDAQNVVLSDTLPAGATNASITPVSNPDGFSFTLANGVFTSDAVTVPNGHQDIFKVTVTVPSGLAKGTVFDDSASATSTTTDPDPYNNAATVIGSTGQSITIGSNYNALNFGQSAELLGGAGSTPPDSQGAVGPASYVEAVNDAVAIFSPRTGTANPTTDSLDDFFAVQGNLPDPNPDDEFGNFFTDPQVIFDERTQRFLVGVMEVDPGPQFVAQSTGDNSSVFDVAVSKSANPTTLTTADWNFYQVRTTEANEFSDYPGNLGYNGGALVVTLNEFNTTNFNQNVDHVLVTAINMSDLTNGVPQANLRFYQSDYQGASLRPTTMHDSTSASDPMWFVQEHLDASGLPDNQHIDVVKMTGVLSSNPTFTTTTLAVNAYAQVVQPLQPDGSGVTPTLDSRIQKVAEQGGTLVAAHNVSNAAGNQDLIQWYQIDVGGATPVLHDQGDVGSGPNTYLYFPAIDINPAGDIGMSYIQSGVDSPDDFLSMYVTGRTPFDPLGTMEAPVLAQAGVQVYEDFGPAFGVTQRAGDLSGINVDSAGNFWAINEFADDEALPTTPDNPVADPSNPAADWGTNVVSFTLPALSGSAQFLKSDSATQGYWQGAYGGDGYNVIDGGPPSYPSYAAVTPSGNGDYVWAASTIDPRALQKPANPADHVAAMWYSATSFTVDVSLTGGTHPVALYLLDWDGGGGRSERVDVLDAATGTVLDSRTAGGFGGGEYLVWSLGGHVQLRFTRLSGPNAVLSGLFFGPAGSPPAGNGSAAFVKSDSATQGTWQGAYGGDGYNVIDAGPPSYPSYATVTPVGTADYVWAASTADPRGLQKPANPADRIAAAWYAAGGFTVDVNMTDGASHQVALYLLDWDGGNRSERVDVLDAVNGKVLDSRTASGFGGGQYLVWTLGGHVQLRVTSLGGPNAVLSGLFFGPGKPPAGGGSASFLKSDGATQGYWQGAYGGDGYNVIEAGPPSYPKYAAVTPVGTGDYVWAASTVDPRALQKPADPGDRLAAMWYSTTSFTVDVNITDGQQHPVALYLLDWDGGGGRSERIDVLDAATGKVLDTRTASNFGGGEYLVWSLGGHVQLRLTRLAGPNAVLSGLFFGPAGAPPAGDGSAQFVKADSATQGTWRGAYGGDGYNVIDAGPPGYPSYAAVTPVGTADYVWAASTADPRALQKPAAPADRIAAAWYAADSFSIDLNLSGGAHQLALYLLDWDGGGRQERIDVLDAVSGKVLDSQTVGGFGGGEYLVWDLGGRVLVRLTKLAGPNAVLSGLFFDPAA
jgi:uncharacterized repeat protein (TIGR01451 family)